MMKFLILMLTVLCASCVQPPKDTSTKFAPTLQELRQTPQIINSDAVVDIEPPIHSAHSMIADVEPISIVELKIAGKQTSVLNVVDTTGTVSLAKQSSNHIVVAIVDSASNIRHSVGFVDPRVIIVEDPPYGSKVVEEARVFVRLPRLQPDDSLRVSYLIGEDKGTEIMLY